jgi:hypothetical protein
MSKSEGGFPIPDFTRKINLLLKRPGYAVFPEDEERGKLSVVSTVKVLAYVLGVHPSQLTRWGTINRVPKNINAVKIAGVFAIQVDWLSETYDSFVGLCNGSSLQPSWSTLLAQIQEDDIGTIIQIDPAPSPLALHMRPNSQAKQLPKIDRGAIVNVSFRLTTAWSTWNAVLLSEDPSGFMCLLPRFVGEPEFPTSLLKLPPKVSFDLRGLRTDIDVTGRCSLVLVATRNPLPPDLNRLLLEDREGKTLEPVLDRLAGHLIPLCAIPGGRPPAVKKPSAVIRRLQYSAV